MSLATGHRQQSGDETPNSGRFNHRNPPISGLSHIKILGIVGGFLKIHELIQSLKRGKNVSIYLPVFHFHCPATLCHHLVRQLLKPAAGFAATWDV